MVEVDVRNQRNPDAPSDRAEGARGLIVRDGHAHDLAPGSLQARDLCRRRVDIGGRRRRHRLHGHGGRPADGYIAHADAARLPSGLRAGGHDDLVRLRTLSMDAAAMHPISMTSIVDAALARAYSAS